MLLGQFHLFTPVDAGAVLENYRDVECQIEHTGRLLLPDHLLQRLAACQPPFLFRLMAGRNSLHLGYPVFRTFAPAVTDQRSGVGRNCVLVPSWAAAHLARSSAQVLTAADSSSSSISGGGGGCSTVEATLRVGLSVESLPTGSFICLKPLQPTEVCSWANPTATLNKKLRDFACLSLGSVFSIQYLDRTFHFEIKSLRPAKAVCIIDCDMQLEFDFDSPPTSSDATAAAAAAGTSEDAVLSDERLRQCGVTVPRAGSALGPQAAASGALLLDVLSRARTAADATARRWGPGVALATGQEVAPPPAPHPPGDALVTAEAAPAKPNLAYTWGTLTFTHPGGRWERPQDAASSSEAAAGGGGQGVRLKDSLL